MPLRRARRLLPVLLAALVLALAACTGGADDPPSPPATTPIAATATTTPTATVMPSPTATPAPTSTATPTPTPSEPPTTFRYDTYDTTGAVAEPGSYAFLEDPADTTTAVITYEGLRDGSARALRIHQTDAGGVSRAAFLDTVEVGDLFEWREAEDCWVRYQVTSTPAAPGTSTREFGLRWVTYTYAGCSGAVSANGNRTIDWSPPNIRSPDIAVPVRHGPWTLHSPQWAGPVESTVRYPQPSTLPDPDPGTPMPFVTTDIAEARSTIPLWREPTVPEDWTFSGASMGDPYGYDYGYNAAYQVGSGLNHVSIEVFYSEWRPVFEVGTGRESAVPRELRIVDGRPALLIYSPPGPNHDEGYPISVWVFDDATGIQYRVSSHTPNLRGSNIESVIAIVRSLFEPPNPLPPQTAFRYDTYDTTGAVAEPGSYAFLEDPADTTTAVITYEGLRDGSARALRIHQTDAGGVSRAAFLDTVEVGDLFEWRQAEDCFVRYRITEVNEDPTGAVPRKALGVEWATYAYTGCTGTIPSTTAVTLTWGGVLKDLGGPSLPAPVMHGPYQLVPLAWKGEVKDWVTLKLPVRDEPLIVEEYNPSRQAVLALPYWRDPDLPEGWYVSYISAGSVSDPSRGYTARFSSPRAEGRLELGLNGYYVPRMGYPLASSTKEVGGVHETRIIGGRLALASYNTPNEGEGGYDPLFVPTLWIYDHDTGTGYTLTGYGQDVRDIDVLIEIAASLFESPNPLPPPTTFRYDSYDTSGEVAEPGSYAFLVDAGEAASVVTTYEGLRDGSATALRIHETDADGLSRAAFLDTVEVGDLFEWREADDCFVRYQVTSMAAASGTSTREFGVKSFTDAYAGCSGVVTVDGDRRIDWSPPVISSRALTSPVRHGLYYLIPGSWAGTTAEPVFPPLPDHVAAIRDLPCCDEPHPWWREAEVPAGWTLAGVTWRGETDPTYGYSAWYRNEHGDAGVEILVGYWAREQYPWPFPVWADTALVREPRIIDGHHALVQYSPAGLRHEPRRLPEVWLFNEETRMFYLVIAWDPRLAGSDPAATIAIARSLFEAPNPQ